MNIEDTLKERINEMSDDVRGGPSLQRAIQTGRVRRRRRAVATVGSGVATMCAVGVVAGAALTGVGPFSSDDGSNVAERQMVLAVPPEDVPYAIEVAVREQLPDGAKVTHTQLSAYGEGSKPLPKNRWDEATAWYGTFEFGPGELLDVSLDRSAGDTEGSARKSCQLDDKYPFSSCDYTELASGEDLTESVTTARDVVPGGWHIGVDPENVKPGKLWFKREVEIQPGGNYMVEITNSVKAESREQADTRWTLDLDAMRRVVNRGEFLEDPAD